MELFKIGKISGTHHLKGTVKIATTFDNVELLEGNKVILENKQGLKKVLEVASAKRINNKMILLDFVGIGNKTDAMALTSFDLYIRRDLLGEINEEEYYTQDLVGMDVYNKDEYLGQVEDVMETGAHDIYIVGEDEIMIPAVDTFVLEIDFENRKIITDLPEELLNLNK